MAETPDIVFEEVPKEPITLSQSLRNLNVTADDVTGKDIFKLAKYILLAAGLMYLAVAAGRIFLETTGMEEVWEYSKVFLNSIISLVLGLYFGQRVKSI